MVDGRKTKSECVYRGPQTPTVYISFIRIEGLTIDIKVDVMDMYDIMNSDL